MMIAISNLIKTQRAQTKTYPGQPAEFFDLRVATDAIDKLITEGGEGFYHYVDSRGLSKDPSLIVLSSSHHYYYDYEEMNNAKTVVNLKELNRIKEIKSLLQSHLHFLPQKCNFVGCFINGKNIERYTLRKDLTSAEKTRDSDNVELGISSRFPFINMLYSLMDLKTNNYLSEKSVALMLGVHGFKIVDMKEINGLTYFHSRKEENTLN
jgi:hypothetical protein